MIITSNKNIQGAYRTYLNSIYEDLFDAYEHPSIYKAQAWEYCINLCREYGGFPSTLKIIGFNCMTFSAGFIGYIDGLKHFFWITKSYDRALPLEKMNPETGEVTPIYSSAC